MKKLIIIIISIIIILLSITIFLIKEKSQIYTEIIPTEDYKDAYYTDISINNDDDYIKSYNLSIDVIDISPELINENFNFILAKKTDYDETYYEIQRTDARYISTSPLANTIYFTMSIQKNHKESFRVYFWQQKQDKTTSKTYIKYQIKLDEIIEKKNKETNLENCDDLANKPMLNEGLIPVKIENDGKVKTIVNKNDWYNYCEKRWANSVLVKKDARNKYLNNENIEIKSDDILAYFVWIPRYSYKLWTTTVEENKYGKEQEIKIKFISKNDKDNGSKKNTWYTHPAFTFGNTELSGIWVGKFELTGNIHSPTILPNQAPIVNYNLLEYFNSSLLFSGGMITNNKISYFGSQKYGLSKETNSHLIKNSEWGAITYLSHSQYGINDKIRINNYFNNTNLTGCGAEEEKEESSSECQISYGSGISKYPQSSTGNITGIFDLTGGTGEYVMAYLNGKNNLSGIEESWFSEKSNQKYYDFYPRNTFNKNFNENVANCSLKTCGGQALYETFNWYMTVHNFADKDFNFIKRGCGNYSYLIASQFCFGYATGEKGGGTSSRVVLITEKTDN